MKVMYVVAFYYKYYSGLLELMFDERDKAEEVLTAFEQAVRLPQKSDIRINSKYGIAVLCPEHFSGAVLCDLDETEELMVSFGVRRARIEKKAQEEYEGWLKMYSSLIDGDPGTSVKVPKH